MKNLLNITSILTKKKLAKIEILDDQILRQKDSLFGKFYEGLLTGKIETDEDAAQLLYGTPDPGDAKYRQLKSRFKRRLLNTLFFVDVNIPLASNYDQALLTCNKEWALVEILAAHEARQASANIARQIFNTALKFHFIDFIVKCARLLREYAVHEENERDFQYYNEYVLQYAAVREIEIRAETYYHEAVLLYQKTDCGPDCIRKMENISNALAQLSEKTNAPFIHYYLYLVWIIYFEMSRDYEGMLEVCQNGEKFLQENTDYFETRKKAVFYIKRLSVYLHQLRYQEGKAHAETILQDLSEESMGWLDFMKYYLLLSLHTDNFINALAIFNRVAGSTFFKKLDNLRRQEWEVLEAVLHYIVEMQGLNASLLPKQRRKVFKISDFITQQPSPHLHSAGVTVQRLTLQILLLLHRRSYQGISERIEQLGNLARYELRKDIYKRSYTFVRLLQQLDKVDFNIKRLNNTEKYLQKLQAHPFLYFGKINQLEVLPYEKLWQLICKHLA